MSTVTIPFNDFAESLPSRLPNEIAQFVKDTAVSLFRKHGGNAFNMEIETYPNMKNVQVPVSVSCVDETAIRVLHAETRTLPIPTYMPSISLHICVYR